MLEEKGKEALKNNMLRKRYKVVCKKEAEEEEEAIKKIIKEGKGNVKKSARNVIGKVEKKGIDAIEKLIGEASALDAYPEKCIAIAEYDGAILFFSAADFRWC
jgi:hypothetical protein